MENRVHGEGEPGQANKLQTQILLLYPVYSLLQFSGHVRLEWFAHLLSAALQASTGAGWAGYPTNYQQH